MREALEIFRKDARHLRAQIAGFLALTGLYGWQDAALPRDAGLFQHQTLAGTLLLVAAWYLTVLVIHEERPASQRQDWLTRPIPWRSVLVAKVLFILAFIHLPVLISQMTVLGVNGVSPWPYLPRLLATQALLLATAVLPAAALAAVTNSLVEFALGALGAFAVVAAAVALRRNDGWGIEEWVRAVADAGILLAALTGILAFEYARRRTWASRALLACVAAVFAGSAAVPAWHAAFALEKTSGPDVELTFDAGRKPLGRESRGLNVGEGEAAVKVLIPVGVSGLADGNRLRFERIQATLETSGERWSSGWKSNGELAPIHGEYWESFNMPPEVFDRIKSRPVRLHTGAALTLLSPAAVTNLPVPVRGRYVPGVGFCTVSRARLVECFAPLRSAYWTLPGFRADDDRLNIHTCCAPTDGGFTVWAVTAGLEPVQDTPEVAIETYRVAGRIERGLDIPAIRLEDYEVARIDMRERRR